MSVEFLGFDATGGKVWQNSETGRVTYNPTLQGAEWTFECSGGRDLDRYVEQFGPITKEKQ